MIDIELEAALAHLDEQPDGSFHFGPGDNYVYFIGRMGGRNIAIVTFP